MRGKHFIHDFSPGYYSISDSFFNQPSDSLLWCFLTSTFTLFHHFSFFNSSSLSTLFSVPWLPQFRRDLFDRNNILSHPQLLGGSCLHHSLPISLFIQLPPRKKSSGILKPSIDSFIYFFSFFTICISDLTNHESFIPSFHASPVITRNLVFDSLLFSLQVIVVSSFILFFTLVTSIPFRNLHPNLFLFFAIESLSNNFHFPFELTTFLTIHPSSRFHCSLSRLPLLNFSFVSRTIPFVHFIVIVLQ